jgi:hypothetical protein
MGNVRYRAEGGRDGGREGGREGPTDCIHKTRDKVALAESEELLQGTKMGH